MKERAWVDENVARQDGKTIIVTGANSGLGYWTTLHLARLGGHVIMACRNPQKADGALQSILKEVPDASIDVMSLDLANLSSVKSFAKDVLAKYEKIDVLINNAGVMAIPARKTKDNFEMQFGVNHLGHFALTGLLIDRIIVTPNSRIVNVSSNAHRFGGMNFEDVMHEKSYKKWKVYGQSKLSNLLFTYELQRWLDQKGASTITVASHPGYAKTNLASVGPEMEENNIAKVFMKAGDLLAQSAEMGATPSLLCAGGKVEKGCFYGPTKWGWMRGYPVKSVSNEESYNEEHARKLWGLSEELTRVTFS